MLIRAGGIAGVRQPRPYSVMCSFWLRFKIDWLVSFSRNSDYQKEIDPAEKPACICPCDGVLGVHGGAWQISCRFVWFLFQLSVSRRQLFSQWQEKIPWVMYLLKWIHHLRKKIFWRRPSAFLTQPWMPLNLSASLPVNPSLVCCDYMLSFNSNTQQLTSKWFMNEMICDYPQI